MILYNVYIISVLLKLSLTSNGVKKIYIVQHVTVNWKSDRHPVYLKSLKIMYIHQRDNVASVNSFKPSHSPAVDHNFIITQAWIGI